MSEHKHREIVWLDAKLAYGNTGSWYDKNYSGRDIKYVLASKAEREKQRLLNKLEAARSKYADVMEAKQDAEQREQELREVFNKAAMKYCENKPPKCYSGFNACLSCGLREICRLFNAE